MKALPARKFGVEIECYGVTKSKLISRLEKIKIKCVNAGDNNHVTTSYWRIVYDGSVSDGFEVVSPPLMGIKGLTEVCTVLDVLTELGAQIDYRCGFHVHVDATGFNLEQLIAIGRRYDKWERKIDAVMPASRRENNNDYCLSMKSFFRSYQSAIDRSTSIDRFTRELCSRYYKINYGAFIRHGTIEFRQHSGTVNSTKAKNWIIFCLNLVETTTSKFNGSENNKNIALRKDSLVRMNKMLALLKEGCTMNQLVEETGLTETTIRNAIKKRIVRLGYNITKNPFTGVIKAQPVENVTPGIFINTAEQETLQASVTCINTDPFSELDPEVLSYFKERATDFGMTF